MDQTQTKSSPRILCKKMEIGKELSRKLDENWRGLEICVKEYIHTMSRGEETSASSLKELAAAEEACEIKYTGAVRVNKYYYEGTLLIEQNIGLTICVKLS